MQSHLARCVFLLLLISEKPAQSCWSANSLSCQLSPVITLCLLPLSFFIPLPIDILFLNLMTFHLCCNGFQKHPWVSRLPYLPWGLVCPPSRFIVGFCFPCCRRWSSHGICLGQCSMQEVQELCVPFPCRMTTDVHMGLHQLGPSEGDAKEKPLLAISLFLGELEV